MLEESENRAEKIEHSVFKLIDRITQFYGLVIEIAATGSIEALLERLREQLDYHDRYEKRRRKSFPERLANVLNMEISPLLTGRLWGLAWLNLYRYQHCCRSSEKGRVRKVPNRNGWR